MMNTPAGKSVHEKLDGNVDNRMGTNIGLFGSSGGVEWRILVEH